MEVPSAIVISPEEAMITVAAVMEPVVTSPLVAVKDMEPVAEYEPLPEMDAALIARLPVEVIVASFTNVPLTSMLSAVTVALFVAKLPVILPVVMLAASTLELLAKSPEISPVVMFAAVMLDPQIAKSAPILSVVMFVAVTLAELAKSPYSPVISPVVMFLAVMLAPFVAKLPEMALVEISPLKLYVPPLNRSPAIVPVTVKLRA